MEIVCPYDAREHRNRTKELYFYNLCDRSKSKRQIIYLHAGNNYLLFE